MENFFYPGDHNKAKPLNPASSLISNKNKSNQLY